MTVPSPFYFMQFLDAINLIIDPVKSTESSIGRKYLVDAMTSAVMDGNMIFPQPCEAGAKLDI